MIKKYVLVYFKNYPITPSCSHEWFYGHPTSPGFALFM